MRGKKGVSKGQHSWNFEILSTSEANFGMGVVPSTWHCRAHCYNVEEENPEPIYLYWKSGEIWDSMDSFSYDTFCDRL